MRRFRDSDGVEYDEIPDGRLRRRLKADDPSPIPVPQCRREIEDKVGLLVEIDSVALARRSERRRRCAWCSKDYCGGCPERRRAGAH